MPPTGLFLFLFPFYPLSFDNSPVASAPESMPMMMTIASVLLLHPSPSSARGCHTHSSAHGGSGVGEEVYYPANKFRSSKKVGENKKLNNKFNSNIFILKIDILDGPGTELRRNWVLFFLQVLTSGPKIGLEREHGVYFKLQKKFQVEVGLKKSLLLSVFLSSVSEIVSTDPTWDRTYSYWEYFCWHTLLMQLILKGRLWYYFVRVYFFAVGSSQLVECSLHWLHGVCWCWKCLLPRPAHMPAHTGLPIQGLRAESMLPLTWFTCSM